MVVIIPLGPHHDPMQNDPHTPTALWWGDQFQETSSVGVNKYPGCTRTNDETARNIILPNQNRTSEGLK